MTRCAKRSYLELLVLAHALLSWSVATASTCTSSLDGCTTRHASLHTPATSLHPVDGQRCTSSGNGPGCGSVPSTRVALSHSLLQGAPATKIEPDDLAPHEEDDAEEQDEADALLFADANVNATNQSQHQDANLSASNQSQHQAREPTSSDLYPYSVQKALNETLQASSVSPFVRSYTDSFLQFTSKLEMAANMRRLTNHDVARILSFCGLSVVVVIIALVIYFGTKHSEWTPEHSSLVENIGGKSPLLTRGAHPCRPRGASEDSEKIKSTAFMPAPRPTMNNLQAARDVSRPLSVSSENVMGSPSRQPSFRQVYPPPTQAASGFPCLCPDLVVPPGSECTVFLPCFPSGNSARTATCLNIDDSLGNPVFKIGFSPMGSGSGSGSSALRVDLMAVGTEVVFAHCSIPAELEDVVMVRQGSANATAATSLPPFASIRADSKDELEEHFVVFVGANDCSIKLRCVPGRGVMNVIDGSGRLLALVEPVPQCPHKRMLRVGPNVDVGFATMAVFGSDLLQKVR